MLFVAWPRVFFRFRTTLVLAFARPHEIIAGRRDA